MSDDLELRMTDLNEARIEMRASDDGDRTMAGYPVVFNRWTTIAEAGGRFLERIAPGALSKTLAERGDQVKVLFNHGQDPSIGEKPLGRASKLEVNEHGMYAEVPLARTSYNEDLHELMRTGVIDGMSFRFSVVKEDWDDMPERSEGNPEGLPERTITELRLFEFGPVTFPAYPQTSVAVRSHLSDLEAADDGTSDPDGPLEAADEGTSQPADDGNDKPHRGTEWLRKADRFDDRLELILRRKNRKGF